MVQNVKKLKWMLMTILPPKKFMNEQRMLILFPGYNFLYSYTYYIRLFIVQCNLFFRM